MRRAGAQDDDELLQQIRSYENFTTIDWVQDSILERNRRIRKARKRHASRRGPRGEITLPWLWSQLCKVADAGQTWFVVTLVGIAIGFNAAIISIVTEWLSDIKMGYCYDGWWLNQQFCCWEIEGPENACSSWHPWSTVTPARWLIYVIFAGIFSFVAAHLVRSLAKYAAGSGISEIKCILAGFRMQGFLGFATFAIKSLTLPLVIASGLSVGKEGPSVHVACCIGSLVAGMFYKFSRSHGKMREIVTAASAAGVAVAFGSPIGGVLFSIEEMSHTFSIKTMWRSFFCALIATVTLSVMNPFRTGKIVLFQVTYDRDWHFFEIMFFVILGIFGGLYGAFVVKFNVLVAGFRRKYLSNHGVAEAVTLATLTAMIGYFNRFMRIDMTESMAILFRECDSSGEFGDYDDICKTAVQWPMANSLFLATIIRMGFVIISYGCKVPAGIFVPSMAIGATFGRMIGIIVKAVYRAYPKSGIFAVCDPDIPCITPGTYAFLGAAAALSGIMRLTVSVVVIMFELTGALTYILPTMIVILVTKGVGDLLGTHGIADEMIRFNGFPLLERDDHAPDASVSDVLDSVRRRRHQQQQREDEGRVGNGNGNGELVTLPTTGASVVDIEAILNKTNVNGFPVVDPEGMLQGYMGRTEVRFVLDRARRIAGARITPDTRCSFAPGLTATDDSGAHPGVGNGDDALRWHSTLETRDTRNNYGWASESSLLMTHADVLAPGPAPALGVDEDEQSLVGELVFDGDADSPDGSRRTTVDGNVVRFWPWVNQMPLTVSPRLPLELVMQLFKKMGPRVILVEDHGRLVGLVTVKDVLRFNAAHESDEAYSGGVSELLGEGEKAWARLLDWFNALPNRYRR